MTFKPAIASRRETGRVVLFQNLSSGGRRCLRFQSGGAIRINVGDRAVTKRRFDPLTFQKRNRAEQV